MPTKQRSRMKIPDILAKALATDEVARTRFEKMPPSHQREHIKYITEAKKPETQVRRAEQTIARLRQESTK